MRFALPSVALGLLLLSPPAFARTHHESFSTLVRKASRLYQQGKYHASAQLLEQAQALRPNPRLLYNIARAHDQAGDLDQALDFYQRYLSSPAGTDPTLLKRSALSVDRLRGLIAQRKAAEAKKRQEQAELEHKAALARAQAEADADAARLAQRRGLILEREQENHRSHMKVAAYIAGGVTVAALATGVVFGIQASSAKSDFTAAPTVEDKETYESRTKSRALVADIGFGVAIASAVTAFLLYPKGSSAAPVVTPTVGPHGAGAALEVSF